MATETAANYPSLASANTFTASQTIKSTDAGAGAAPTLLLYRDSASPAAADQLGEIRFDGNDSNPTQQTFARIRAAIVTATGGAEDSKLVFRTLTGAKAGPVAEFDTAVET